MSQEVKLPFIDFNKVVDELSAGTPEWSSLRAQVQHALEEFGCFEAQFHGVPMDLQKKIIGSAQELFDLPLESKRQHVSEKLHQGYVAQLPKIPWYESAGIKDADAQEKVDEVATTFWPQGHLNFSKTVQSFTEKLSRLDRIIRRMIVESLGLEKYLDEHLNSTYYLFRLNKYKEPWTPDRKQGIVEHTDNNLMTILYQDQVGGLEIQFKDGEWISVEPSPKSFIVMVGDSLYAWTNGRLCSPYHRVMISGSEARYSVGLFTVPREGYKVKAPDELVEEGHPPLFMPFEYDELMKVKRERGALADRIYPQLFS